MTPSDETIARPGSESANDLTPSEFVRSYLPMVRRIVFPMVLNHEDADDLTQEIMIKAVGALGGFRAESSLSTWLTRISLNTTYTFLQKRKAKIAEPLPGESIDRSFDHSPVHAAIGNELDAQIRARLGELSPKLRAAIVLIAIEGVSPSEAAEIESCGVSTMHWRIHEARNQLRSRLREYVHLEDDAK